MESLDDSILKLSGKSGKGFKIQNTIIIIIFSTVQVFDNSILLTKQNFQVDCSNTFISNYKSSNYSISDSYFYSEISNHWICSPQIVPYISQLAYFIGQNVSLFLIYIVSQKYFPSFSPKKLFTLGLLVSLIGKISALTVSGFITFNIAKLVIGFSSGFILQYGVIIIIDWCHSSFVFDRLNFLINGSKFLSLTLLSLSAYFNLDAKVVFCVSAISELVLLLLFLTFAYESRSYLKQKQSHYYFTKCLRQIARKVDYHGKAIVENVFYKNDPLLKNDEASEADVRSEIMDYDHQDTYIHHEKNTQEGCLNYIFITMAIYLNFTISYVIQTEFFFKTLSKLKTNYFVLDYHCADLVFTRYGVLAIIAFAVILICFFVQKVIWKFLTLLFFTQIIITSILSYQWYNNESWLKEELFITMIGLSLFLDQFLIMALFSTTNKKSHHKCKNDTSDFIRHMGSDTSHQEYSWRKLQFIQFIITLVRTIFIIVFIIFLVNSSNNNKLQNDNMQWKDLNEGDNIGTRYKELEDDVNHHANEYVNNHINNNNLNDNGNAWSRKQITCVFGIESILESFKNVANQKISIMLITFASTYVILVVVLFSIKKKVVYTNDVI